MTIEEVGLPARSCTYQYRARLWRGRGPSRSERIVLSSQRLPDRCVLALSDGTTHEGRWVYAGDPCDGVEALVSLSSWVLRMGCPACRQLHFFLVEGGGRGGDETLMYSTAECGSEMEVSGPWGGEGRA